MLKKASGEQEKIQQSLNILEENNKVTVIADKRIAKIVKSPKSFTRLDEADVQKVDLHEGIENTVTLLQHGLKNKIEIYYEFGTLPPITCYPNQLNQIFMNLLKSAIQTIDNEGLITITMWTENVSVFIRISDSGKGIPQDTIPKIFDPDFTQKSVWVGTGPGLSVCTI